MKKIFPQRCFYSGIFAAYLSFIKLLLEQGICEKKFTYKLKGVGQKSFSATVLCNFNLGIRKISEKIYCDIKYEERSKRLSVAFKLKSPKSFLELLEALEKASLCLLSSYLYELVWGLIEAILPVEQVKINDFNCLIVPIVAADFKYALPFLLLEKIQSNKFFTDDVYCILYNIFIKRKNPYSFIKVNADDILFLRGIKKNSAHYKKEDKKRVGKAIWTLCSYGLIKAKKIKKYEWKIFIPKNFCFDYYFAPREVFCLNPRTKYFEKYLAHLICAQAQKAKNILNLKDPVDFLYKNVKYLKPFCARERIENAFDEMVKIGLIKNWEYKKINENELCGADWIVKYKKLKIIFDIKNCGRNLKTRPAI